MTGTRRGAGLPGAPVALLCLTTVLAPAGAQPPRPPGVLDDFAAVGAWTAAPSDGVTLRVSPGEGYRGRGLRLDFDFNGRAGYAVVRRALPLTLPPNYELSFWIRGQAPTNNLEFKLADSSGENVWWVNRRDFVFPARWTRVAIRKRQISFAWGPAGGGELRRAASLEFAITAGSGGRGTVWIDELALSPREPVPAVPPAPRATASIAAAAAPLATDGDSATAWRSSGELPHSLRLDFSQPRELGGISVVWDSLDYATDYVVEGSADGRTWARLYRVTGGDGGRDHVALPESELRGVRLRLLRSSRGRGVAVREVVVQPLSFGESPNALYFAAARDAPRGSYPRPFTDSVQSYWTIIGATAAEREAMVSEDGALEVGKARLSIEPFLFVGGRLRSWADVRPTQSLARGYLPIPSVSWDVAPLELVTTAFVAGVADSASLVTRYRVTNRSASPVRGTLFLALRNFQVNPPWQFLNAPGGTARVRTVDYDGRVVRIDGGREAGGETVVPVTRPAAFGATTFDAGDVTAALRRGTVPRVARAADSSGRASAALAFAIDLEAGGTRDVVLGVPFAAGASLPAALDDSAAARYAAERLAATGREWEERLGRVSVSLPAAARDVEQTLRTTVAYVLINQDGPAIQPGSRSYERSWIRDGSLTSEALLRMGHADRVRAFLQWFAPFQYANGKVPCCVDRRGADPVPEHDSHGQFVYLARQYYRYTGDRAVAERMWPHVALAVSYIDSLRQSRRTPEYRTPLTSHFYGLMPPSISHEGYSAKPMHSYWDDFFTLRGLKDAAALARELGRADTARRYQAMAAEFRTDLMASIRAAMAVHRIDFIPGAADLGDFDATSTTVAIEPGGEEANLPRPALANTFERYWRESANRAAGRDSGEAYTPYELRTVGTFIRLGQPERAHQLLEFFFRDQRPAAWRHWAEVVWRDPRAPRFIGDMPHTWVGSDFIRSVLDMFAYEREFDSSLVVGAGVPEAWARADSGVVVRALATPFGRLDLTVRSVAADRARVRVGGALRPPPGGVVVRAPFPRRPRGATLDGVPVALTASGEATVHALPAEIEFRY